MKKIVLTGGPCGGKTTVQRRLAEQIARGDGGRVVCVPEVATLVLGAGFSIRDFLPAKKIFLQGAILSAQIALEDALATAAGAVEGNVLMICDRGALDGKAYCSHDEWGRLIAGTGVSEENLLERYDLVFHLPTLASGEGYGQFARENPCRFESREEAIETDGKLLDAWAGHPHRGILPSGLDIEDKVAIIMGRLKEI